MFCYFDDGHRGYFELFGIAFEDISIKQDVDIVRMTLFTNLQTQKGWINQVIKDSLAPIWTRDKRGIKHCIKSIMGSCVRWGNGTSALQPISFIMFTLLIFAQFEYMNKNFPV